MKPMQNEENEDQLVLVAVKPALMPDMVTGRLPRQLSVRQALEELQKAIPQAGNASAVRAIQQLNRETAGGDYHFLAATKTGLVRCAPTTAIAEIAVPREIRTPEGIKTIPTAAIEVQAYAKVGYRTSPVEQAE